MSVLTEPSMTDVQMVVEEVWSTFLGAEEPLLPGLSDEFEVGWSAAVSVSGAWEGMVSIEVPAAIAQEITQRMLGVDDATDEDISDAIGEMVNMIGGNVKSLMPGPSVLSLPMVAAGRVAASSDSVEVCRLDALWLGQPLLISVHVHQPHP